MMQCAKIVADEISLHLCQADTKSLFYSNVLVYKASPPAIEEFAIVIRLLWR